MVAGNLLHHAVEMLLKGDLSRTLSLDEIKRTFGHALVKTARSRTTTQNLKMLYTLTRLSVPSSRSWYSVVHRR